MALHQPTLGIVAVASSLSLAAPSGLAGEALSKTVTNFFSGPVVEYHGATRFRLACCPQTLELGLVREHPDRPDAAERIRAIIGSQTLDCSSFPGTEGFLVWCTNEEGRLLSQILIDEGLVIERCEISKNQFGNCPEGGE